jgi:hypothetical protein
MRRTVWSTLASDDPVGVGHGDGDALLQTRMPPREDIFRCTRTGPLVGWARRAAGESAYWRRAPR